MAAAAGLPVCSLGVSMKLMEDPLLKVEGLKIDFWTEEGILKAVRGIDFSLLKGEVLGIVGESGCGKSVTALSILRLIPSPPGSIREGKILFQGRDLLALSIKEMRKVRGDRISMIFQEPMTSLNPLYSVGDQIMEAIILHQDLDRKKAYQKALEMLDHVGIPDPILRMKHYPYQLSGGMRQRVMIAIALSCRPELLIADEPTTALDVTIQAQILDLLEKLRDEIRTSMILITHNLALVKNIAHHLAIMYAGKIVEYAPTRELFKNPLHPYTRGLFECIPRLAGKRSLLPTIAGNLPNLIEPFENCAFLHRCSIHGDQCQSVEPLLREATPDHMVSCYRSGRWDIQ
jgi:oligopeptide/dipeptide ABC transporter ATP-binding protein